QWSLPWPRTRKPRAGGRMGRLWARSVPRGNALLGSMTRKAEPAWKTLDGLWDRWRFNSALVEKKGVSF
ncbi:MAG: hypothetical protein M3Y08_13160, partial [Fibrobacterota bacterium]|nr:hypothetical protein [Fibrobacterota bacterium]